MNSVSSGPKYYYVVTFSDGSECRIDHARGPRPALVAAKSQFMRSDARTIRRYHVNGTALSHGEWNVLPPKPKKAKKVKSGARQQT